MAAHDAVTLIVMGIAAVLMVSYWKQVITLLLLTLFTVLCFGIYSLFSTLQG